MGLHCRNPAKGMGVSQIPELSMIRDPKKDAAGLLPPRPILISLVQALRRPLPSLKELSGRSQRGDSAWNKTLDHLLSLLMETPI